VGMGTRHASLPLGAACTNVVVARGGEAALAMAMATLHGPWMRMRVEKESLGACLELPCDAAGAVAARDGGDSHTGVQGGIELLGMGT
jgi:hypothetical protein